MSGPERPADRIVRLMREGIAEQQPAPTGRIVVKGDGNILGDVININHGNTRPPSRSDRRALRASALTYIRSSCRHTGDPLAWVDFARAEFGVTDLDALTDMQLERVRGWCTARERGRA